MTPFLNSLQFNLQGRGFRNDSEGAGDYLTHCCDLDGVNQFIRSENSSLNSLDGTGDASWCCWFKAPAVQSTNDHMQSKTANGGQVSISMKTAGELINRLYGGALDRKSYEVNTNYADNAWHHIASVYDGTGDTWTIYVDGALATVNKAEDDAVTSIYNSPGRYRIGARGSGVSDTNVEFFAGRLTGVCAFSAALSLSEVQEFTAGATGEKIRAKNHSQAANCLFAYDFKEDGDDMTGTTGTIQNSSAGAGDDLTPYNTVAGDLVEDAP